MSCHASCCGEGTGPTGAGGPAFCEPASTTPAPAATASTASRPTEHMRRNSRSSITAAVQYATSTGRYQVSRIIDGRTEWADTMDREDAAWTALTSDFARMSLFRGVPLEPNAEYYVRVRAHTSPRNATFLWPWAA